MRKWPPDWAELTVDWTELLSVLPPRRKLTIPKAHAPYWPEPVTLLADLSLTAKETQYSPMAHAQ